MLNELHALSESLGELGLLRTTTHPNLDIVVKEACLLVEIDKAGVPRQSRLLSAEETNKLWRHSRGNHHSFPAIRVQEPLLAQTESLKIAEVEWKKLNVTEKLSLLSTLDFSSINPQCTKIRISEWSRSELRFESKPDYPELAALEQLIKVFPKEASYAPFLELLARFFERKLKWITSEAELDLIKKLLVGEWDEKRDKYVAGCMTYYDMYETDEFPNLVGSGTTQQALVRLLNERDETSGAKRVYVNSPLSGVRQEALGDKYPNPNLPILGLTYLYSKKSDTPCLTRYGRSGVQAYRIGRKEANAMNDALAFLTKTENKGKTWSPVSDCNRDKPNLLLAYLEDDPSNHALLAQIMADPSVYSSEEERIEELESHFEALCQQVLGNTKGLLGKNPKSKVILLLLESLDAGRKQVVYEKTLSLEQLKKNLLTWLKASENCPPIGIRQRGKEGIFVHEPLSPGPNEIIQLSKVCFANSGQITFSKQSQVSLGEIYDLYMPQVDLTKEDSAFVAGFLDRILSGTGQLLGDLGQRRTLDSILPARKEIDSLLKVAKPTISLISILLWHLGLRKESFMNKTPFNLGQFLQLADRLHKEYCLHVRNKGDKSKGYPPQFMGNELLPIALENPIEGLNRLDERMRIYIAWAKRTNTPNALLDQLGEVSRKMACEPFPEQFGPVERAQVFLGYLATLPGEDEKEEGGA